MPTSTISLLQTIEWSKKFNFNRRSALGNYLEPALTNANTVLQTILGAPFAWRWNRVVTGFITVQGQQDYYIFNWAANTNVTNGWMLVDSNGNCQTVSTTGTTDVTMPAWNLTVGGITIDGTAEWTNLGSITTPVSPTYSFGWIETASVFDVNTSKWVELESKICSGLESTQSRPRYIAAQGDDGSGNISFRLMQVPDAAYPVAITIQQRPTLFKKLNQTWSPIPDEYSHIYNWGFLALTWLFGDDPRFQLANQKFVTSLLSSNEGLDDTEKNIFLGNWQYVTGQPIESILRMQQGQQARGV